jgi:hypothetical protein
MALVMAANARTKPDPGSGKPWPMVQFLLHVERVSLFVTCIVDQLFPEVGLATQPMCSSAWVTR